MPVKAYFKLQALSTFVHEVAHHFDYTSRIARGRWLADDRDKVELFARHSEHEWTQSCVVPYLEEAYPQDVAELLDWLEVHGTIRFTLGELIPDPRRVYVSTILTAVEELLKDVLQATDHLEKLLSFAVNLKIADMYQRAQEVIDQILIEVPEHEDALELRANTWIFQEKYQQAASLALQLIQRNRRNSRTWATLIWAYERLGQWSDVIEAATESLSFLDEEYYRLNAIARRCSAYWTLGKREESDDDLRTLQGSERASWLVKRILRQRKK